MKRRAREDLTSMLIEEQYETINQSVSYLPVWFNVFLSVLVYLKRQQRHMSGCLVLVNQMINHQYRTAAVRYGRNYTHLD